MRVYLFVCWELHSFHILRDRLIDCYCNLIKQKNTGRLNHEWEALGHLVFNEKVVESWVVALGHFHIREFMNVP